MLRLLPAMKEGRDSEKTAIGKVTCTRDGTVRFAQRVLVAKTSTQLGTGGLYFIRMKIQVSGLRGGRLVGRRGGEQVDHVDNETVMSS